MTLVRPASRCCLSCLTDVRKRFPCIYIHVKERHVHTESKEDQKANKTQPGSEPAPPPTREGSGGASDHSATEPCYICSYKYVFITLAYFGDLAMELTHSRPEILWVRASWSLPLNLKLLSDVYFHISSKKLALLLLFFTGLKDKKFSSIFFIV